MRSSGKKLGDVSGRSVLGMAILSLAALAVGVGMLVVRQKSLQTLNDAKSWIATPCVIETCGFTGSRSDEGGRSLDFVYRYEVGGKTYQGHELDSIVGRMGDDDEFEEQIYESFPAGATATCYVDPADPSRSVFDREHGADSPRRMWLLAFPFSFVGLCFGLGVAAELVSLFNRKPNETVARTEPKLGPAPRDLPLVTRAAVLAGAAPLAWLFLVGFTFVFVIMDGPASYARLFAWSSERATTKGTVTDSRRLESQEFYVPVYQFTVAYEVDGTQYSNRSYARGQEYAVDEEVEINFPPDQPDAGTIAGARASDFTWWHSAIPLGVLLLILVGLAGMHLHNFRVVRLLRHGKIGTAQFQEPVASDEPEIATIISDYRLEVTGRSYRARWYGPDSRRFRKSASKPARRPREVVVLYDARKPKRNIIVCGVLESLLAPDRSAWDSLTNILAGPFSIIAIFVLLYGAGLI